ncbi:hypothetical protein ZIOFF_033764 [Zingiber officinale]|uniref:Peptidase S9A N-terminal domain-containing protein n=1 Tax=Zingiber officinale TaxID=94328 RepID=A0A8J5GPP1_ZINOF|nr:hypothetical protein ZIOFF_033764 [Zingiber officinale]
MGSLSPADSEALPPLHYPPARRDESVSDDYHGVRVADPYRWLEDPDAEEVKEFVEKQVALTNLVLAKYEEKEKLRQKITALFDHPRYDTPYERGGKCFYYHNTGLQAQSVLYVQKDLDKEAEFLLDPNKLSEDGTVALSMTSVSKDGKYLAYRLSASGSDWVTIKVMRVDDKEAEPDSLSWVKFSSVSWTHDGNGFFYGCYPARKQGTGLDAGTETNINLNHEFYYHFMGTDQWEDILCWRDPDHPKYIFSGSVTYDGKYVILEIEEGFKGSNEMLPFVKLFDNFEARYEAVANDGSDFTFLTNKGGPRYKLPRVDLKKPELWTDIITEHEKDVLESATAVNGNQIVVCYLSDVKHVLQIRDLGTGELLHGLPLDVGSVSGISGRREDSIVFIGFTSFLTPGIIYKCALAPEIPEMKIFREISVIGFDRTEFEVKQVFSSSKDRTKIPMFVVSKKNTQLDGSNPVLLYGYGGFNISITPSFTVARLVLAKYFG